MRQYIKNNGSSKPTNSIDPHYVLHEFFPNPLLKLHTRKVPVISFGIVCTTTYYSFDKKNDLLE